MAMMAMQQAQQLFTEQGFMNSNYINPECGRCSLEVHFDLPQWPKLPISYIFTSKEYQSHRYYSEVKNAPVYVRVLRLEFNW